MSDFPAPKKPAPYVDRDLDLQFHLGPVFLAAVHAAERAGWSESEVADAMAELTISHLLKLVANGETDRLVAGAIEERIALWGSQCSTKLN